MWNQPSQFVFRESEIYSIYIVQLSNSLNKRKCIVVTVSHIIKISPFSIAITPIELATVGDIGGKTSVLDGGRGGERAERPSKTLPIGCPDIVCRPVFGGDCFVGDESLAEKLSYFCD